MATNTDDIALSEQPRPSVVLTRWVLMIGVSYTVLYGAGNGLVPLIPHQLFVAGLLLSSLALQFLLWRGADWRKLRWFFTVGDVLVLVLAVELLGTDGAELYVVYFGTLLLATVVARPGPIAALTIVAGLGYGAVLYMELGAVMFRDPGVMVRLPLLLGIAIYFGSIVQEDRSERAQGAKLLSAARQIAQRAKHLAKEQYRLLALSEIGRLGLSGVRSDAGEVLFEIVQRVQKVVGVDRCSLVIFERDGAQAYVAASADDLNVEVRLIKLEDYPELQVSLQRGEITELYPGKPRDLWQKVQEHLPPDNPFRSFLIVPIQRGKRVMGALYLRDVHPDRRYTEDDRSFCGTAAMMTAAFLHGQDMLEQLRSQSRRDGLTGLLNFQAFTEEATKAIRAAGPQGGPFCFAVADLDNLKELNDRWGHMAGNRLIITAGNELTNTLDDAIAVCRYGGDEFVAMVPGDKVTVAKRLESLLEKLSTNPTDLPKPPRISIGVSEFTADGEEPEELLDAADQAMYLAKNGGGHRIQLAGRAEGGDTHEYAQEVLEAVVSVQARRYLPDRDVSVRDILAPLENAEDTSLDSALVRQTLEVLMKAVEAKDPYTHAHSQAVAELARSLAEAMRFPQNERTAIEIAGLVHDVGKIGVPEKILRKEGCLSSVERRVVERHPEIAAQLLEQIPPLRAVVPLVFHHQERWDGSGYPTGLRGEEIPAGAQVVALCDAYDALTSARAFRSALTLQEARRVIARDAGTLWNPDMVRVFLKEVATEKAAIPIAES
ncbi:MAG: diguanylate cyclase [Acidobacteria bacterium]|nr:diguanylate cyclase [Acidobacteriota bacterium]